MKIFTTVSKVLLVGAFIFNASELNAAPMDKEGLEGVQAYQAGDYKKALELLTKASNAGNIDASEALAQMYYMGNGVKKDYQKAYTLLQPAVKANYPDALYFLGQMYYFGYGAPEDKNKAFRLYTRSARFGDIQAQYKLASLYQTGCNKKCEMNFPLSIYWYVLAEQNGNNDAKNNYFESQESRFKKELPYCLALGRDNVGQAYYQGIGGLKKSNSEALDWMQKAAETDPNLGVVNLDLAKMYHINGDDSKAFEYAQKAVKSPYAPAMQYLGTMHQQGIGTDKDPVKAYAYLTLAVNLYKNPDAKFYSKYAAPCMPNYQQTTEEFNESVAQDQLDRISLNDKQKEQANKLIEQVKANYK